MVSDQVEYEDGFGPELEFKECYYDHEGDTVPHSYSDTSFMQETPQEMEWMLEKMREALTKPFLSTKNFPQEV